MMYAPQSPKVLWILFAMFLAQTIGFAVIMLIWDFTIIDEMSDPSRVADHIAAMGETQRRVHAWMTATLDVAYPLTYGALFAGLAQRAFHRVFSLPALLAIPTDLMEGYVQVLALNGNDALLWLKAHVTPLKLGLFGLATVIAIIAAFVEFRRRGQPA